VRLAGGGFGLLAGWIAVCDRNSAYPIEWAANAASGSPASAREDQ